MLGDSELDQLGRISDNYRNLKTVLSGAKSQYSTYESTPDINMTDTIKGSAGKLLNPDTASLNVDSLVKNVVGGFASSFSNAGGFKLNINNSNIRDNRKNKGLIPDLIGLIMGVVELPMRFSYLFKSLMEGTGALGLGIGGLTRSVALATKDIYILIVALLNIIFKYFLCILSFTITTFGGCFFIHIISLFFVMLHLFIIFILDTINEYTGIDVTPAVDDAFEYIRWPTNIHFVCYTCFGKSVKLRDILVDVGVIEDIGNMISYDFNNSMPRYMKPGIPLGTAALKSLSKAMN